MPEPIQFIGYVGPNNTPATTPGLTGIMGFPGAVGDTFQLPLPPPDPKRYAVPYLEKWVPPDGSPVMEFHDDGSAVIRDTYVAWESYREAVKDHLGFPIMALSNGGRYISRLTPKFFPHWTSNDNGFGPTKPFLYCTEVLKVVGVDCPTDLITKDQWNVSRYEVAQLTVKYETLTYDIREDSELIAAGNFDILGNPDESSLTRYVTIDHAPGSTYLTLPQGSFVWAGYGGVVPGTPGKMQPDFDVTITWHHVPTAAVPLSGVNPYIATTVGGQPYIPAIEDCLGTVNKFDFAGFKKGTLLLTGAQIKRIRSAIGDKIWDISLRMKRFPVRSQDTQSGAGWTGSSYCDGHNLLYWVNPTGQTGGYYEVIRGPGVPTSNARLPNPADGLNLFNWRSFADLFRVPQLKMDPGNA